MYLILDFDAFENVFMLNGFVYVAGATYTHHHYNVLYKNAGAVSVDLGSSGTVQ